MVFKKSRLLLDLETTGLNPYTDEIIGFLYVYDTGHAKERGTILRENGESEKQIISKIYAFTSMSDYIYTWNGEHFDIPFLRLRSSLYPETRGLFKDLELKHKDMRQLFPKIYNRRPSLDEVLRFYGENPKKDNGRQVVNWWYAKDIEKIKEYMIDDLRALEFVYNIVLDMFGGD